MLTHEKERRKDMPFVHVQLIGNLTEQQKAEIAKQFTETLQNVAKKPKQYTQVVFEELPSENWALGGKLFSQQ
jgi:4-oxalocrotonate tautomerase